MAKYIKPTLDTKFHIDFSWWAEKNENFRVYLENHACQSAKEALQEQQTESFDWINPVSGEVFEVDILWHLIYTHCQEDPDFLDNRVPLTSAIFRAFIANNNTPLTPAEIHEKVQKQSPELILKTIGKRKIYKGIKPVS